MKTYFLLPAIIIISALTCCSGQNKNIDITFIANSGYLIHAGKTNILIDALCRSKYYISPPDSVLGKMITLAAPFEKIDYLLFTHPHPDHCNDSLAAKFLSVHKETALFAGTINCDSIKAKGIGKETKMTCIDLDTGQIKSYKAGKAKITAIRLKHTGNAPVCNIAFLIKTGQCTIFDAGDALIWMNKEYLNKLPWESLKVDVLFLEYFDANSYTLEFIKKRIKPKHIVLTHASEEKIPQAKQTAREVFTNAIVFEKPMQKITFTD